MATAEASASLGNSDALLVQVVVFGGREKEREKHHLRCTPLSRATGLARKSRRRRSSRYAPRSKASHCYLSTASLGNCYGRRSFGFREKSATRVMSCHFANGCSHTSFRFWEEGAGPPPQAMRSSRVATTGATVGSTPWRPTFFLEVLL